MSRPDSRLPTRWIRFVALSCALFAASCAGDPTVAPVSPSPIATPAPSSPQDAVLGAWRADAVVLSRTGDAGCGWGVTVGETRADVQWVLTSKGDSILMEEDMANWPTDHIPYSGTLTGRHFTARYSQGDDYLRWICQFKGGELAGSFSSDFSSFEAVETLTWGDPRDGDNSAAPLDRQAILAFGPAFEVRLALPAKASPHLLRQDRARRRPATVLPPAPRIARSDTAKSDRTSCEKSWPDDTTATCRARRQNANRACCRRPIDRSECTCSRARRSHSPESHASSEDPGYSLHSKLMPRAVSARALSRTNDPMFSICRAAIVASTDALATFWIVGDSVIKRQTRWTKMRP